MRLRFFQPSLLLVLAVLAGSALPAQEGEIVRLPFLKPYTMHRASSYDRTGGNDDGAVKDKIKPGETRAIAEIDGPGIISHIWITLYSEEPYHLKKIVLRMYWDGERVPSVEAPIGDFFGLGLGEYVR
jgi:hypothetical protein